MREIGRCGLEVLQTHEEQLALLATEAGPAEIAQFCAVLAEINNPDRDHDKVKKSGARMVRIARLGDLAHLDAMLEPGVAMQLKATLTAMARADRTPDDPRSHPERCADALERILAKGMAALDTTPDAKGRRRPRRHVVLHAQLDALLGLPEHGQPVLARFGMVSAATAERLCCDALVTLVVEHGDTVLNVGRTRRLVSPRQYTALAAHYATCVVPGCRIPFADCEIHHLWWWSLGGPTDLDLQLPLCQSHHIWLHEGGYSVVRKDAKLQFRNPQGGLIANLDHTLSEQLHLLQQQQQPPPTAPEPTRSTVDDVIDKNTANGDWPDSPYLHGTWGWNGKEPGLPPGHAPPERK